MQAKHELCCLPQHMPACTCAPLAFLSALVCFSIRSVNVCAQYRALYQGHALIQFQTFLRFLFSFRQINMVRSISERDHSLHLLFWTVNFTQTAYDDCRTRNILNLQVFLKCFVYWCQGVLQHQKLVIKLLKDTETCEENLFLIISVWAKI